MVPHFTAEMWKKCEHESDIEQTSWPEYDEDAAKEDLLTIVVQVNGKVRSRIEVPAGMEDEVIQEKAVDDEKIKKFIADKAIRKVIVVKNKLVNIVI